MKTKITKTILLGSIIIGIVSCNSNGNTKSDAVLVSDSTATRQDVTTVSQDTTDEWKYRQDEEAAIKENNQKIAEMKTRMQQEKTEVREKYTTQIDTLEYENTRMETRLHTYKRTDRNAWQDFKFHFNKDMDSIGAHISRIKL